MPVYAIRAGENGPVKFGHSKDPLARLATFQTFHYEHLRLVRLWEGGAVEERKLHLLFADLRMMGEWFSWSQRVMGNIGLTVAPLPGGIDFLTVLSIKPAGTRSALVADTGHADLIRRLGGKGRLGYSLGLSDRMMNKWHVRGIPSKYWHRVVEIGAAMEPPVVVTADELDRTKPGTVRAA